MGESTHDFFDLLAVLFQELQTQSFDGDNLVGTGDETFVDGTESSFAKEAGFGMVREFPVFEVFGFGVHNIISEILIMDESLS